MAYSRAWDEAFPPDTQTANLLGQDVRNTKIDTRERIVSFAAGPLADRPTPEAVWGSANDGVMYFATDTSQTFRWNGSSWIEISGLFGPRSFVDSATVTLSPPTVATDGNVVTLPASTLVVGSVVDIYAFQSKTAGDGVSGANVVLFFGSTIVAQAVANNAAYKRLYEAHVNVLTSTTQFAIADVQSDIGDSPSRTAPGENVANAIIVKTRILASDNGTVTFSGLIVTVHH